MVIISTACLGMAACSTTTVKSQSVPISYKVGESNAQYASLNKPGKSYSAPRRGTQVTKPDISTPMPYTPGRKYSSMPTPVSPMFDPNTVDRKLRSHQRVGKRYTITGKSYTPKHEPDYDVIGTASWYGDKFHGKPTASGEVYNKNDITAAHKTLPLNSMVFVTNVANGRSLMVRVNDRGPFIGDRIIDLSEAAARQLGTIKHGLGTVRVQYAGPADPSLALNMFKAPGRRNNDAIAERSRLEMPYKPLREFLTPSPQLEQSPSAPIAKAPAIPEKTGPEINTPYVPPVIPDDGGQVTLTIKGPIHMAGSKDSDEKPRFIPAVHVKEYKTGN